MLIEVEDDANEMGGGTSSDRKVPNAKCKRRLTSKVWSTFKILPLAPDGKQRCQCKVCKLIYLCDSKYGTWYFNV